MQLIKFLKYIFLINLFCVVSEAYFVVTDASRFKTGIPTDVFVAGFGDDQGSQFLKTAILGAQVSRDRFPERQRIIISAVTRSFEGEKAMLLKAGFVLKKADENDLQRDRLLADLKRLQVPISSMQLFGHNNPYNGFRLQSRSQRLSERDSEFPDFGNLLAPNAFVVIHSCNSGWLFAPAAAKIWNRPVFGSLASAEFEEPMSDGNWYVQDAGMYPDGYSRIGKTTMLVREQMDCGVGKCLRLKTNNVPYADGFGKFAKGLGFYKVFSPSEKLAAQALVHFTLLYPSVEPLSKQSSRQELMKVVSDWMCPTDKNGKRRAACARALQHEEFKNNKGLSFFVGEPVACTLSKCFTSVKCSGFKALLGFAPCKTYDIESKKSTVFSDQMLLIRKGLDLFEQGQLNL